MSEEVGEKLRMSTTVRCISESLIDLTEPDLSTDPVTVPIICSDCVCFIICFFMCLSEESKVEENVTEGKKPGKQKVKQQPLSDFVLSDDTQGTFPDTVFFFLQLMLNYRAA